jgi:hypothetical protein
MIFVDGEGIQKNHIWQIGHGTFIGFVPTPTLSRTYFSPLQRQQVFT